MLVEKHQQLYHTFLESFVYQDNIFGIKGSLKKTLSQIFWVLYRSKIESNTNAQVSTPLTHIF